MMTLLTPVYAKGTVHFLEALAANVASPLNSLPIPNVGGSRRFLIRAIRVLAMEQIAPEFYFFSTSVGATADVDTDPWISKWQFPPGMGVQLGGSGLWRYYVDALAIPYYDRANEGSLALANLHVVLENGGPTAKSADAAGALNVTFWLEAMQATQG